MLVRPGIGWSVSSRAEGCFTTGIEEVAAEEGQVKSQRQENQLRFIRGEILDDGSF